VDETLYVLAFYFLLAFIPAAIAANRGRSPLNWFLVAVLLSPLIAVILVVIMPRGDPQDSAGAPPLAAPPIGVADELGKLAVLRDAGTLTAAEFERQKDALLGPPKPEEHSKGQATHCSRCGKLQSPYWRLKCNHCGASYRDYPLRVEAASSP
jgi:hypothetical protein